MDDDISSQLAPKQVSWDQLIATTSMTDLINLGALAFIGIMGCFSCSGPATGCALRGISVAYIP
jgi:hypothetical protein